MIWFEPIEHHKLDCGDNSCRYAAKKGGMRTNGGCRCARNRGPDVEHFLLRNYHKALLEIERLNALRGLEGE